jgi:hypothetical protein
MAATKTKLWSFHDPSFSLTAGKVDHAKSSYFTTMKGVREAYHKLWSKLGESEGQIIWCHTTDHLTKPTSTPRVLWAIEIPENKIICRVDDIAWNKILNKEEIFLPKDLKCEWNRKPRTGDWWDELIVRNNVNGYLRSALIRHPVSDVWVRERIDWWTI